MSSPALRRVSSSEYWVRIPPPWRAAYHTTSNVQVRTARQSPSVRRGFLCAQYSSPSSFHASILHYHYDPSPACIGLVAPSYPQFSPTLS
jgi:hypothetical protein